MEPVDRLEVVGKLRLVAAGLGRVAVLPAHQRRQAHQDRLGAAAALQAEQGAAVPDQVELDVAAAAVELELALALAVGGVAAALDDRKIRVEEVVAHAALVGEAGLERPAVEIIEEQPADAARLAAVLE